jgi:hypothetical protein
MSDEQFAIKSYKDNALDVTTLPLGRYDYEGKDNGSICMLPWVHTTITMENKLRPCCAFDLQSAVQIKEMKPGVLEDSFRWLRKKMLAGEKVNECHACYQNEKYTPRENRQPRSMRGQANTDYRLDLQDLTEDFIHLRGMEISLDNICNLQCKMCDSMFSSNLYRRDAHLMEITWDKVDPPGHKGCLGSRKPMKIPKQRIEFIKALGVDWKNIEHIKILGGEPFYSPNFEKLLDHLLEEGTPEILTLEIVSNLTNIIDQRIIDKLNKFAEILLTCSLDGINDYNAYQRWGSPGWEKTLENYRWYHTKINNMVKHHIHMTYSLLNLNGFAGDIKWFKNNYPEYRISFAFVRSGEYSPYIAPQHYIDWLEDQWDKDYYMDDWHDEGNLPLGLAEEKMITLSKPDPNAWQKFKTKVIELDKFYDSDLKDYNPELARFLKLDEDYEV